MCCRLKRRTLDTDGHRGSWSMNAIVVLALAAITIVVIIVVILLSAYVHYLLFYDNRTLRKACSWFALTIPHL